MDNENLKTVLDSQEAEQITSSSPKVLKTKSQPKCLGKKSSSSIKSKKSSNILSAIVRKTKYTKNKHSKSFTNLAQNLNFICSVSSLGIHTEEDDIQVNEENYEKLCVLNDHAKLKNVRDYEPDKLIHAVYSERSISNVLTPKHNFFKKLLKRNNSSVFVKKSEINEETKRDNLSSMNSVNITEPELDNMVKNELQAKIPTSFIKFPNQTLNSPLETSLQEVLELANHLQDSETHLLRLLTTFIKDPSLQKELIEILFQHSKLQWETERRTASLTNEMWMQQIDIGRTQERALQDSVTSLVKQNRQLQIENEIMFRKYERLVRKFKSVSNECSKHKCINCDMNVEHILRHNEELQRKLEAYHLEIENVERELQILQKHNEMTEQHLRHTTSYAQNLKVMSSRAKMGYELEIASLQQDLERNNRIIKESLEAGSSLLEDFKRQLKILPNSIKWTKCACNGMELVDLINLSKECLSEFAKELISLKSELCVKEKDIEALQQTNSKLQESLQKSSTELDAINKKMDAEVSIHSEKSNSNIACNSLQPEVKILQDKIEKLQEEYNFEKSLLVNTISEYEKLNNEILDKNQLIEKTKLFVSNITSENIALRGQIDGLNKVLMETGAGDMFKELSVSQDQLYFYKSQYYQLLSENQLLLEKQTLLENERKGILTREETNYEILKNQMVDFENTKKDNKLLQQQYEAEHQTVISLQAERMKYLEEKGMLKTIFNHMKAELTRIQNLEGTVIDITKEANKLALVAEYNQKLGCKLKNELLERDKTILQLKSSVDKLNDIQLQQTKDKLSLCHELSEMSQIKDKLSEILSVEVQKNCELGDSKKEVVDTAASQIRKYEELQKNDRLVLKSVSKDLKSIVALKNHLQNENEKLKEKIAKMKLSEINYLKKIDNFIFNKNEQELLIKELQSLVNRDELSVKNLEEKLNNETSKYNNDLCQLKTLILQLQREKEQLDNSVKYLQNNTQKLHKDLNEIRKNEKDLQDELKKCLSQKQELELENLKLTRECKDISAEKEKLISDINNLNALSEKMLDSLESNMKASVDREQLFKQELEDSKVLLMDLTKDIEKLKKCIKDKEMKITHMDKECLNLKQKEKQYIEMVRIQESLELESDQLRSKNTNLENEIQEIQGEYNTLKIQFEQSQQAVLLLQGQLRNILEQKENVNQLYKHELNECNQKSEDLQSRYVFEINNLKIQVNNLTKQIDNEKFSYATLSQMHKEMSAKFVKSIKDMVDEKNARHEAITKLKYLEENLETLNSEKADLQQQITILLDGMNQSKNRINMLNQEKETLQGNLDELQKRYNDILKKCLSLENQIISTEFEGNPDQCETLKQQILQFHTEIQDNQNLIKNLKTDITNLEHQITTNEFQKSELTLRLHEIQSKLETEQNLCQQMKNTHRVLLMTLLQFKDDGKMDPCDCNKIIQLIQSTITYSSDES